MLKRARVLGRGLVAVAMVAGLLPSLASAVPDRAPVPPVRLAKPSRTASHVRRSAANAALPAPRAAARTRVATDWSSAAVTGEVIVVPSGNSRVAASAVNAQGGRVLAGSSRDALVVRVPKGVSRQAFARSAAKSGSVAWVQPNYRYHATVTPNDPLFAGQWGMARIGATTAWTITRGRPAVSVAVVDTGVSLSHPDLAARVDKVNDYDFVNGDATADDDEGHGTHVAGIIAATANNSVGIAGVAPEVRILPVKVLDANGSGTSKTVAAGIKWAADRGAKIINLSLGGAYDPYTESAVAYAQGKGCVVVAATGNDGLGSVGYPAALPGVVGVGAVNSANVKAAFSNYGSGTDLVAPGVDVLSTVPGGYERWDGTSMATPFVSGVAALLASARPAWTSTQIVNRMYSTAQDLGTVGIDARYGRGLVRADKALTGVALPDDRNIPGVPLPSSPVTGTLDVTTDTDDVYRVLLGAGQTITVSLTGDAGTDFDLWLFGPNATDVDVSSQALANSELPTYPEQIVYTASTTGVYYIDAFAYKGSGSYTITWSTTGASDDNVPGVPLTASPVLGTIDEFDDTDDVFKVHLRAGEMLALSLETSDTADADLYLFGPDAIDVSNDPPIAGSASAGTSEFLRYVAPVEADYCVDVYAYSGASPYALSWTVGPFNGDDNIPGVDIGPSPVTGVVGGLADTDDVYKVYLQAGQRLDASLDGAPGTDHDLYIYGPDATDADVDAWVANSATLSYPESVSLTAAASGYYYVDVFGSGDSGAYSLTWSKTVSPDDDIPGVDMPSRAFTGEVGENTDSDDVFRVPLLAGEEFAAELTGPTGTDFDVYLYAPGSVSAREDTAVASAAGNVYPKRLAYRAPVSGDYYFAVHAFTGNGTYGLRWGKRVGQVLSARPSGGLVTLTRRLGKATVATSARAVDASGVPIAGKVVALQRSTNGTTWSTVKTLRTAADGRVSARLVYTRASLFYLRWSSPATVDYRAAVSGRVRYRIR